MSDHGYETGRLNLPFVGVSTFAKRELVTDWSQINADAAVLGAPLTLARSGELELGLDQEAFVKHQLCSVSDIRAHMIMKTT